QRWRPKSWRMHVPVICDDDHVALSAAVLIHFPREQVSDLTETLADIGDDDLLSDDAPPNQP
ncbi:MAG: hypothetical protein ACRDTG_33310, partial [Pseudonocardiaceae bacterium]